MCAGAGDVAGRVDLREPGGVGDLEVGLVVLRAVLRRTQRRPIGETAADGELAGHAVRAVPVDQVHLDAPQGQERPAVIAGGDAAAPQQVGVVGDRQTDGPIHLTHQVPHRRADLLGPARPPEAVLHPPAAREGGGVLEQHPPRVGERERVVGAQLQQHVGLPPGGVEAVLREGRQLDQTGIVGGTQQPQHPRTDPEGDGQPCRTGRELRLGVGQRA